VLGHVSDLNKELSSNLLNCRESKKTQVESSIVNMDVSVCGENGKPKFVNLKTVSPYPVLVCLFQKYT